MFEQLDVCIVGAGPYGLSIAAHLKPAGVRFKIFGTPMQTWRNQMPKGMHLKSDGFASSLSDPSGFTLKRYCAERGIAYHDTHLPVSLELFTAYTLEFQRRLLPETDTREVEYVEQTADGFRVKLNDGQTVLARRVVLAVGITYYPFVPETLAALPREYVTHAAAHHNLDKFKGKAVAVVGGGASAVDVAAALVDLGADTKLIARRSQIKFHNPPGNRSLWQRLRHPMSGLGPGMRSYLFTKYPGVFRMLPVELRLKAVKRALGPSSGWFMKDKVVGRLPMLTSQRVDSAKVENGRVLLGLVGADGQRQEQVVDHVIAATGYRVDLRRLKLLDDGLREQIAAVDHTPVLSASFESSVPGLYFTGLSAANTFGPMMRFAYGADYTAKKVSRQLIRRSKVRKPVSVGQAVVARG